MVPITLQTWDKAQDITALFPPNGVKIVTYCVLSVILSLTLHPKWAPKFWGLILHLSVERTLSPKPCFNMVWGIVRLFFVSHVKLLLPYREMNGNWQENVAETKGIHLKIELVSQIAILASLVPSLISIPRKQDIISDSNRPIFILRPTY